MTASYEINTEYNSVQITFDCIPAKEIREKMKSLRFRWHKKDRYWYARQTEARLELAKKICGIGADLPADESPKPKPEKANAFGVQVGDIFSCTWGYDQTNVDFFQVLKLCGEKSIRVRQVQPKIIDRKPDGGMSETNTYEITREILPPAHTVFIKDQENGDLKRLKSWAADGVSDPIFDVGSGGYICHKEPLGQVSHYRSWCH